MKNKKVFIGIIVILIIIILLIIALLFLAKNRQNEETEPESYIEPIDPIEVEINQKLHLEDERNDFYNAKICVEKFLLYYMDLYNDDPLIENKEQYEKQVAEMVYSMLSKEYIEFKQITKENLKEKLQTLEKSDIQILKIYKSEQTELTSYCFVEGTLRSTTSGNISNFKLMLNIDMKNNTFEISLEDYINEKGYNKLKVGDELEIEELQEVENRKYNIFEYQNISDNSYIDDIFLAWKDNTLHNTKQSYQYLNTDYAKKRFKTLQNYEEYIKNNYKKIVMISLDKYKKEKQDDYTQYTCLDNYGNYYIFRETSPMQYTVILDTYTIDLPEFTAKYNNAKDEEKVSLNMQKFFQAINKGDYEYSYNKLDATYKSQNFKTLAEFEKYMKENFFEQNKISAGKGEKQGDVYLYNMTIEDASGKSKNTITKTFVMQLKEGTEFVMSFEVN